MYKIIILLLAITFVTITTWFGLQLLWEVDKQLRFHAAERLLEEYAWQQKFTE